ncbi:MAG: iron-sulfur cluster insertion protein ErpA [Candidatus Marinimicrobia bacterium]|nr:iron-sulfur cluster insertion protein ErpA [Candidatus Neomarinimicrobiota bacterium]
MQEEAIIFSEAAANKVGALLQDEENNAMHLRVYVAGGGCAGFQYGFSFDESRDESDTMVEKNGVKLVVDPMSIQYLLGAEIDFQEDLQGARFVIKNPNANTTCSCGSSFS